MTVLAMAPVLLFAGCGSVAPNYYTLATSPGTPQGGGPLTVQVQTPTVADYLSRDYIVLNNTGNQLHLAQSAAWAEPLPNAIGRILTLDLGQRLPGSNVYTANSGATSRAEAVVEVNVSQFAEDAAGQAEITATMSVHRPDAPATNITPLHVVAQTPDGSIGALAASLSQLLGQVANQAANDLRTLGSEGVKKASTEQRR